MAAILAAVIVFLAAAAWFRLRYSLNWPGDRSWNAVLEIGFPGLWVWSKKFPDPDPLAKAFSPAPEAGLGQAGFLRLPQWPSLRRRLQRALFRFATDTAAWGALGRAGVRLTGLGLRLVNARVEGRVRNADPAALGRWAGWWQVTRAFPGLRRVDLRFDFDASHPPLQGRVRGGLSALRFLLFLPAAAIAIPWGALLARAWRSWRHAELAGWRAFLYRRLQRGAVGRI